MRRFNIDFVSCSKEKIMVYSRMKYLKLIDAKNKQSKIDKINNKQSKKRKQKTEKLIGNKYKANKLREDQIKNDNKTERKLKIAMRNAGINFIYQKPYSDSERYVCVDFYLSNLGIVIELDGKSHNKQKEYDNKRTKYLINNHGINKVIRFTNKQVIFRLDEVIKQIQLLA